jgi:pyruvate/2-oxoglutarate dehydrogenase complex dihydrolipoamide dehydrogenase (E3) component
VNGKDIKFLKACICTGGRPKVPDIAGLNEVPFYTSENIFNLTKQPKSLLVVGGGPIGCELGQAFQRFGTQVFII